uniref:Uncharacterized protein n=1 Tax=Arundo donax TaxID=35708 RepID=A0A0A9EIX4_ARUDO
MQYLYSYPDRLGMFAEHGSEDQLEDRQEGLHVPPGSAPAE